MLQFNAIHYATPSGVLICYMGGPGVPPLRGYTAGLPYGAPAGARKFGPHGLLSSPAGYDEAATGKSN